MYKNLTRFTALDSPVARRSLARVIEIAILSILDRAWERYRDRFCCFVIPAEGLKFYNSPFKKRLKTMGVRQGLTGT